MAKAYTYVATHLQNELWNLRTLPTSCLTSDNENVLESVNIYEFIAVSEHRQPLPLCKQRLERLTLSVSIEDFL